MGEEVDLSLAICQCWQLNVSDAKGAEQLKTSRQAFIALKKAAANLPTGTICGRKAGLGGLLKASPGPADQVIERVVHSRPMTMSHSNVAELKKMGCYYKKKDIAENLFTVLAT